jgi:transposase
MDTIGMDLHKRESQLCGISAAGEIWEQRIATTRARLTAVLGPRPRSRILVEASTESEWVAQHLEALGHEVIVADPNFAPMYATRTRRVKTDRRDARTLAEACRLGAYRPAHRLSAVQRHIRTELAVRDQLVQTRVRYVALVKARVRSLGERLPSGAIQDTLPKLAAVALPPAVRAELAPVVALLAPLNAEIAAADARLTALATTDPVVARLTTVPAIGPVTAVAFVATLDDITRFASAHQVEAFLGLTPIEYSSGESLRRGRISKTGNPRMRWLLVEAAWRVLRTKQPGAAALRAWAERIAGRRGKSIAAVALARRLAGILYAMWRDGAEYRAGAARPGAAA